MSIIGTLAFGSGLAVAADAAACPDTGRDAGHL
jgi:hypothetical protein